VVLFLNFLFIVLTIFLSFYLLLTILSKQRALVSAQLVNKREKLKRNFDHFAISSAERESCDFTRENENIIIKSLMTLLDNRVTYTTPYRAILD